MRGQQLLTLLSVLTAPAAALRVSGGTRKNTVRADFRACAKARVNSSNSALFRQVTTLKANTQAVMIAYEANLFADWKKPDHESQIKWMYRFHWLCDLLMVGFESWSLQKGVDGSTSAYTVLASDEDDGACRIKFSRAMDQNTEEDFKEAAACIQLDMDKCVASQFAIDVVATCIAGLQSMVDTLMSYMEFRHAVKETKKGLDQNENELDKILKLLCMGEPYESQPTCEEHSEYGSDMTDRGDNTDRNDPSEGFEEHYDYRPDEADRRGNTDRDDLSERFDSRSETNKADRKIRRQQTLPPDFFESKRHLGYTKTTAQTDQPKKMRESISSWK